MYLLSLSLQEDYTGVGVAGAKIRLVELCCTHTNRSLTFAALLLYEFLITFEDEVEIIWRSKVTAVSLLLLLLRWVSMVGYAIVTSLPGTSQVGRRPLYLREYDSMPASRIPEVCRTPPSLWVLAKPRQKL